MKISRKDTVIIAVLVNISLLALLLATAGKWEKEEEKELQSHIITAREPLKQEVNNQEAKPLVIYSQAAEKNPVDEIDQVLQQYALKQKVLQVAEDSDAVEEPVAIQEVEEIKVAAQDFFIVNVKKNEVLSKIAKTHNVSVEEIMKLNSLENTKLRIGQSLKIPIAQKKQELKKQKVQETEVPACISNVPKKLQNETEYYVIKDGDNPWKVAKRFHLKYEDLLQLNNLNEEKARNLKIGQKIRIR